MIPHPTFLAHSTDIHGMVRIISSGRITPTGDRGVSTSLDGTWQSIEKAPACFLFDINKLISSVRVNDPTALIRPAVYLYSRWEMWTETRKCWIDNWRWFFGTEVTFDTEIITYPAEKSAISYVYSTDPVLSEYATKSGFKIIPFIPETDFFREISRLFPKIKRNLGESALNPVVYPPEEMKPILRDYLDMICSMFNIDKYWVEDLARKESEKAGYTPWW